FAISAFVVLLAAVGTLALTNRLLRQEEQRTRDALATAVANKAEAEANLAKADSQRQRALENFERTYAGAGPLLQLGVPGLATPPPDIEAVRKQALEQALKFFQGYPLRTGDDPIDRYEAVLVLERIAALHDRLDQPKEAEEAGRRNLE